MPQYQHSTKRFYSPVRSLHPKFPPYSCTRLSTRLTPTIYTQAPQQQHHPSTKSLSNNLHSPTSQTPPSCSTTTTTAACCKSRICSAHVGSSTPCSNSGSNQQLQSSHHHYHNNKFQSEASSSLVDTTVSTFATTTTAVAASSSSGSQHTLKPLPLPSVNDNNAAASNSSLSFSLGGELVSVSSTTLSSASSLHPPVGGCITPTSYKKKTSFLQRKKPILTRSEVSSPFNFFVFFLLFCFFL